MICSLEKIDAEMDTRQIRKVFLEFFQKKGHKVLSSSSLIPHNDPTLMFTNSGMVQFKNCFLGLEEAPSTNIATAQKCLRAGGKHNDIENVGYTSRHHTFFEMLGNFSFGGYFKKEAISFAWEFLTEHLNLSKSKLWVTVFHTDEEAYSIWKSIIDEERIIKISTKDNFWSAGSFGPCGPCSEIFYDHGESHPGGLPGTKDEDGGRYVEIWNMVFMEYNLAENGDMEKLARPSIDTGMGIERIAAIMQGVYDNFDTDILAAIIGKAKELAKNISGPDTSSALKIISDHLRSTSFLIADGALPSNEGRGYVLRRIIRRALRYVYKIGETPSFLSSLLPKLIEVMGEDYPELIRAQKNIESILTIEAERFWEVLSRGSSMLDSEISESKGKTISGALIFKLYDSYGMPLDTIEDILKEHNLSFDKKEFDLMMAEQKKRAKESWIGSGEKVEDKVWHELHKKHGDTTFMREALECEASILAILNDKGEEVKEIEKDKGFYIILNQTCFYAESGGQVGDTGSVTLASGDIIKVLDTKKKAGELFVHKVISDGDIAKNSYEGKCKLLVDRERRRKIEANHSATHLLNFALRKVLGEQVSQRGSLVDDKKLRFDFSHFAKLTQDQMKEIEIFVNDHIFSNLRAKTEIMSYAETKEKKINALFDEKYGEFVRVVSIGEAAELCGGTHVEKSGDIGMFKLISEESIASGVRRIEALTGIEAVKYIQSLEGEMQSILANIKCEPGHALEKLNSIIESKKLIERDYKRSRIDLALKSDISFSHILANSSLKIHVLRCDSILPEDVREIYPRLLKHADIAIVIYSHGDSIKLSISSSKKAISLDEKRFSASRIAEVITDKFGGSGGGSKSMAQIGKVKLACTEAFANYLSNTI